jgi:hypothetical protein
MNIARSSFAILILAISVSAQNKERPRIYVSESQSWQSSGSMTISRQGIIQRKDGGARPQTAEIIKTLNERCPGCIVTKHEEKADYVILLEHEGGKSAFRKDNKFALFNKEGDVISSGSDKSLGRAVKYVCAAMMGDWKLRKTGSQPEKISEQKNN